MSALIRQKQDEVANVLRSRKRKLIELWEVSRYSDCFPQEPYNSALAEFLQFNDLEKGRYFNPATLPPRPHYVAAVKSSESVPQSIIPIESSATRSPVNQSVVLPSTKSLGIDPTHADTIEGRGTELVARSTPAVLVKDGREVPALQLDSEDPNVKLARNGSRMKRKREENDGHMQEVPAQDRYIFESSRLPPDKASHLKSSPSDTRMHDFSPPDRATYAQSPLSPDKARHLESPPYSPGTQPQPATGAEVDQPKAPDGTISPRGEDQEQETQSSLPEDTDVGTTFRSKKSGQPYPTSNQAPTSEIVSTPSSATYVHSNNTSRADVHSPATSPDDDHRHKDVDLPEVDRSEESASFMRNANDLLKPHHSNSEHESLGQRNDLKVESTANVSMAPKDAAFEAVPAPVADVSPRKPETLQTQLCNQADVLEVHALENEKRSQHALDSASGKAVPTALNRDLAHMLVDTGDIQPPTKKLKIYRSSDSEHKHPSRPERSRTTELGAMIERTLPLKERFAKALRSVEEREPELRHSRYMRDYLFPMLLKQAHDNSHIPELSTLLTASHKTLMTSDWQTSHHEKHDALIVKRIWETQLSHCWSLRQKKPYPEPQTPPTHLDHLLKHVRWLQTDFREERKYKIAVARQLAEECKVWMLSDDAMRISLQVKTKASVQSSLVIDTSSDSLDQSCPSVAVFSASSNKVATSVFPTSLDDSFASQIPLHTMNNVQAGALSVRADVNADGRSTVEPPKPAIQRLDLDDQEEAATLQGITPDSTVELTPEDHFCALFDPDPQSKGVRMRVNVQYPFRPPTCLIPSRDFYEHRKPSQWTQRDDQDLRKNVGTAPSNWFLIAENMHIRSRFVSSGDRRTQWECYERMLSMDGLPGDISTRQYARQFQQQLEKARAKFNATQVTTQQQVQHHAQSTGQPVPAMQPARFPTPTRIDNKYNRRFIGMMDGARKLAKRREQIHRQQQHPHQDHSNQDATASDQPNEPPNPHVLSKVRCERQKMEKHLRHQQMRQQAKASASPLNVAPGSSNAAQLMQQAQRQQQAQQQAHQAQQQSGNQPLYNSGLAQRIGNQGNATLNVPNGANGHVAGASQARVQQAQQQAMRMGLTNGTSNNNASQLGLNARQPNMQNHARLAPQFNGTSQTNDQNFQNLANQAQQLQQQGRMPAYQAQRQMNQTQFGRGSPSMGHTNGLSNGGLLGFNNNLGSSIEAMQSPKLQTVTANGSAHGSPNMSQQMMMTGSNQFSNQARPGSAQPHVLSSGHVPTVAALQHQITQQNPHLNSDEVRQRSSEQLKHMLQHSRQVALNSASGIHNAANQQAGVGQNIYAGQAGGAANNQANGMNASQLNHVTRSPSNPMAQQQSRVQYAQQMNQQMRMSAPSGVIEGNGSQGGGSPAMGMNAVPYVGTTNRTPTPSQNQGMRPPSSGTNMHVNADRSGSAQGSTPKMTAASPRAMS